MTNYEILQKICDKAKENIDHLYSSGKLVGLSRCIAFADDLSKWVAYCDNLKDYRLVEEAQNECINSIYMCAQGFYKEAISTMRQFFEHLLFAILLSTNDFSYKLWQVGQHDMRWSQIVEEENGVFGRRFIGVYAGDLDEGRSTELLTIAKNVYRECSEYVHGNFEKLRTLPDNLLFDESAVERYIECFDSIQYLVCMALFIRFRHIFNKSETLVALEPIISDNLGTLPEIQQLLSTGEE